MIDSEDRDNRAILKEEDRTRIEIRNGATGPTFRKVYRNPAHLRWRTFLLPSRARREYRALRAAFDAGLPCVEPISFGETRHFACVATSEVTSKYTPGQSLKPLLRGSPIPARDRRRICTQLGTMLRRFHAAGLLWMNAMPRNVILPDDDRESLTACDLPKGIAFHGSILGRRRTLVDLYSMGFSKSRREELSPTDQRAFLLAYCAGNREHFDRLWRALASRTHRRQTLDRTLLHGSAGLLLPTLRRLGKFVPRRHMRPRPAGA